jgi:hypothetical protein
MSRLSGYEFFGVWDGEDLFADRGFHQVDDGGLIMARSARP